MCATVRITKPTIISYVAGTTYRSRWMWTDHSNLQVLCAPQEVRVELASNYAFRSEQGTTSVLNDVGDLALPAALTLIISLSQPFPRRVLVTVGKQRDRRSGAPFEISFEPRRPNTRTLCLAFRRTGRRLHRSSRDRSVQSRRTDRCARWLSYEADIRSTMSPARRIRLRWTWTRPLKL